MPTETPTETVTAADGTPIALHAWPVEGPRAVVLVAHGMAEHGARYDRLARRLNEAGLAAYAPDHRGHGATAGSLDRLGHFADSGGWDLVVGDLLTVVRELRRRHPGLPLVYLGHSMGSMLGRSLAIAHGDEIDLLVLSGTAGHPGLLGRVGRGLASLEARVRGQAAPSRLMDAMTFGGFNKPFTPARTRFDWLSRDEAEVDAYVADARCGNVHSARFYVDLLTGLADINHPRQVARIRPDLPVLVLSGAEDPVGGAGQQVREVADALRAAGVRDVTLTLYPDGRHEMFNETNRDDVTDDVLAWLDAHLG